MSITEITSLITAIGAVIGVMAAALWGREAVNAKDASIEAKNTLLDTLRIGQEEVVKAKEVQITNLKDAQLEVIKAKDTHIRSLDEKIDFLNKLNPDAIKQYYLSAIEQFSDMADEKENRIKELNTEIAKLNSDITDLHGKLSQLQVDNEILENRYGEASHNLSGYKEENQYLTREIDKCMREARALRNTEDEIREMNELNVLKIEKLQDSLKETRSTNERMDAELYEIKAHNKWLKREINQIEELQSSIVKYENNLEKAKDEISVLKSRIFEIERENKELSNQNTIWRKDAELRELTSGKKICRNCEHRNNIDAKYCSNCGKNFDENAA